MPLGLILWEWDNRGGPQILGKYPTEVEVSMKSLMQLYSQHLYYAKADIVSMYVGALNVLSVWTGSTYNYFLTILLSMEEESENYAPLIPDILYFLLSYIEQDSFAPLLPSIYQRFVEYTNTNFEQKRAILYCNEVNRAILKILSEEGCFYKDELQIWLDDNLKKSVFNFELSIQHLSSENILKIENIKGLEGTYLFLLQSLIVFRSPPKDLQVKLGHSEDKMLGEQIQKNIEDYFSLYDPNERDNVEIAHLLSQHNYWRIIDMLRKTNTTENTLNKLKMHGVNNVGEIINTLKAHDIIDSLINENKEEIFYLKSDIIIDFIPIEFMLARIQDMYLGNEKSKTLLLGYLKILRDDFLANRISKNQLKRSIKRRKTSLSSN